MAISDTAGTDVRAAPAADALAIEGRRVGKAFHLDRGAGLLKMLLGGRAAERFWALQDVDITVPTGQFVGVLGRNGSGKSTLLRTLSGIYEPSAGHVSVYGPVVGIYELGLAGNDRLTGREFVRRWFSIYGTEGRPVREVLDEVGKFAELGEYYDQPTYTYSTGMRGRLFFAVATALSGQIYLIDEVLSVGDEQFQGKSRRRMRERLASGTSGVLATHDWTAALQLCRTTCVLERGHVVDSGPSGPVVQRYLNLPPPQHERARFAGDLPKGFACRSGEDAHFVVPIEVLTAEASEFGFGLSVESFQQGLGWEHLLYREYVPLIAAAGRHEIEVAIPRVPLSPGRYSLNLFLAERQGDGSDKWRGEDVRSWTYGEDLYLEVTGEPAESVFVLPVEWTVTELVP
jgi:lipopolysaccharide transport system ATP-binding protein